MSYCWEVENLLRSNCMRQLLDHVRGGKMSDDRMKDFVRHLGELSKTDPETPNILYGNHIRRMSRERDRRQDTELLQVMSDWWEIGLYEMTQEAAITALVKALSHPDVYCNPLASQISTNFKKVVLISILCCLIYCSGANECWSTKNKLPDGIIHALHALKCYAIRDEPPTT